MQKGKKENRREEVIDVCEKLYQEKNFTDITIKEIGSKTSFTRTSIYNYFLNKEEIFLALLKREYQKWQVDLQQMLDQDQLTLESFADQLATSLAKRPALLKILSSNFTDLDIASRMENLIDFKESFGSSLQMVDKLLQKFFTEMTEADRQHFLFAFFPFIFGVYPYTVVTDKQKEAMAAAKVPYVYLSLHDIVENCILTLLRKDY
ncbi:TetR family transcriptional regulator [Streptococcus macacae]|uniref:Transcriptional regulator, TetR family n=1 Tax=Streptococcus macacae NCTC 11558 TaxID=764298 RepID=G5JUR1_9STRE|nr:TetR family transcriptional regulator [Streptococcus macacae]EHJ52379.1 transcriptional regulator, TetR family [Streptococcus macacae NCTC 11558]SUN78875.1 Bacterial regulatory proteins, tetR family [Streptococcus macacae NCTC 11558]